MSLLLSSQRIENVRSWLVAATCNGCRHYWRRHGAQQRMFVAAAAGSSDGAEEPASDDLSTSLERKFLVAAVLACLTEKQRDVLRLHYFEGLTIAEIAERLNITCRYARKATSVALRRAREAYHRLALRPPHGSAPAHTTHGKEGVTNAMESYPSSRRRSHPVTTKLSDEHPGDETLSAMADGRLGPKTRREVTRHARIAPNAATFSSTQL